MKNITLTIPDNCELVKAGNTYVIKEKDIKPKTWLEFCENFPIKPEECFIDTDSDVLEYFGFNNKRKEIEDRVLCINKKEAEAFLALMQLRQLRKAWVGNWEQPNCNVKTAAILYSVNKQEVMVYQGNFWISNVLSFPTNEMAQEFLNCFKDLCETAKILL